MFKNRKKQNYGYMIYKLKMYLVTPHNLKDITMAYFIDSYKNEKRRVKVGDKVTDAISLMTGFCHLVNESEIDQLIKNQTEVNYNGKNIWVTAKPHPPLFKERVLDAITYLTGKTKKICIFYAKDSDVLSLQKRQVAI